MSNPSLSRTGSAAQNQYSTTSQATSQSRLSTLPSQKPRQLSHLHAQLAQLTANVSDLENLLRMTAVQAESMRGLGGYMGGMFMAASKVLGEETVRGGAGANAAGSMEERSGGREGSQGA